MSTPAEVKKLFSSVRILGNGDDRVTLMENELFGLLWQCCADLGIPSSLSLLPELTEPPPDRDYYRLPLLWFQRPQKSCPSATELLGSLADCIRHESDFRLYFKIWPHCTNAGSSISASCPASPSRR